MEKDLKGKRFKRIFNDFHILNAFQNIGSEQERGAFDGIDIVSPAPQIASVPRLEKPMKASRPGKCTLGLALAAA